jgi:hypothetical protein
MFSQNLQGDLFHIEKVGTSTTADAWHVAFNDFRGATTQRQCHSSFYRQSHRKLVEHRWCFWDLSRTGIEQLNRFSFNERLPGLGARPGSR